MHLVVNLALLSLMLTCFFHTLVGYRAAESKVEVVWMGRKFKLPLTPSAKVSLMTEEEAKKLGSKPVE